MPRKRTFKELPAGKADSKPRRSGRSLSAYVLALFVVIFPILAASSIQALSPPFIHYESSEFSLDYPAEWKMISNIFPAYRPAVDPERGTEEVFAVADPRTATPWEKYTVSFTVSRKTGRKAAELESAFSAARAGLDRRRVISERKLEINGVPAREIVYRKPRGENWYTVRDVWLAKNGTIYLLSCRALPGDFDGYQRSFDLLVDSFRMRNHGR